MFVYWFRAFSTVSSLTVSRFLSETSPQMFIFSTGNSADQSWEKQVAFQRLGEKMSRFDVLLQ